MFSTSAPPDFLKMQLLWFFQKGGCRAVFPAQISHANLKTPNIIFSVCLKLLILLVDYAVHPLPYKIRRPSIKSLFLLPRFPPSPSHLPSAPPPRCLFAGSHWFSFPRTDASDVKVSSQDRLTDLIQRSPGLPWRQQVHPRAAWGCAYCSPCS